MPLKRLVAALVVLVALTAVVVAITTAGPEVEKAEAAPLPPPVTTTSEPDFAAIVASDTLTAPLSEEEEDLTEMVLAAAATTTTVPEETTTTLAPTTTTQAAAAKPKSPPATTATTAPPATTPPSTTAPGYRSGAEKEFASLINSRRSSKGLGTLSRNGTLDSHARAWAKRLAERGSLSHSNIGSLMPPWVAVGENVGSGGSVKSIFNALVASSSHDSNMRGDFTHFGIGVWQDSNGVLWTAHVFAR